jgi:uncharacterized protein with GYD domain
MITMMVKFKYTPEAMKAIFLSGDDRQEVMKKMIEPLGGKFISSYGMQGQYYHMMMIAEFPSMTEYLAVAAKGIFLGGAISDYKAIQLIPTETLISASKLISDIEYTAPSN